MKTQTIEAIEQRLNEVSETLKSFPEEIAGENFGHDKAYAPESFKREIEAICDSVRNLVNAHDEFVRISAYTERVNMADFLAEMNKSLAVGSYNAAADKLDELKVMVRRISLSEYESVLKGRIDGLNEVCARLEKDEQEVKRIKKWSQKAKKNIQSAEELHASIVARIGDLEEVANQVNDLQEKAQTQSGEIDAIADAIIGHQQNVDVFAQTVADGKGQLTEQEALTKKYQEAFAQYQEEQKKTLEHAQRIINEAKAALEYTTAYGISAAYQEKYKSARKLLPRFGWLASSLAFLAVAGWVGFDWFDVFSTMQEKIQIGDDGENNMFTYLPVVIIRFTLIPLIVAGAWFCASQYVKNKNLAEDYSYKAVLAQSMMAFMDKIDEEEDKGLFLRLLLNQILQDPLRKTHAEVNFLQEAKEIMVGGRSRDSDDV